MAGYLQNDLFSLVGEYNNQEILEALQMSVFSETFCLFSYRTHVNKMKRLTDASF